MTCRSSTLLVKTIAFIFQVICQSSICATGPLSVIGATGVVVVQTQPPLALVDVVAVHTPVQEHEDARPHTSFDAAFSPPRAIAIGHRQRGSEESRAESDIDSDDTSDTDDAMNLTRVLRRSPLDARRSPLDARRSTVDGRRSALDARYSETTRKASRTTTIRLRFVLASR